MTRLGILRVASPSRIGSCAAALLLALAACATPIDVGAEYDRDVDFANWKRWKWNPVAYGVARGITNESDHPVARRIRAIVEESLAQHGFAPAEAPDFLVGFHTEVERRFDVIGHPYSGWWSGWGWSGGSWVVQYDVGTLYLDFVDRRRGILAWQGTATSTLDSLDPAERDARFKEAVDRIVAQFPPPGTARTATR